VDKWHDFLQTGYPSFIRPPASNHYGYTQALTSFSGLVSSFYFHHLPPEDGRDIASFMRAFI